jgi:hypothetical protein
LTEVPVVIGQIRTPMGGVDSANIAGYPM